MLDWPTRPAPVTPALIQTYQAVCALRRDGPCDPEAARAIVDDVMQLLPEAAADAVQQRYLALTAEGAPPAALMGFLCDLAEEARAIGLTEYFFRPDFRRADDTGAGFIEAVNRRVPGKRTVVFVAVEPYFVILREAMHLRRNGYRAFLLCVSPLQASMRELFGAHFDGVIEGLNSGPLVRDIVQRLQPDLFHVQIWMFKAVLGALVLRNRGGTPTVCEFYDVTSLYGARDVLASLWGAARTDHDLALERLLVTQADGIVHRFPPHVVDRWRRFHGSLAPDVRMMPYPCPEFSAPPRTGARRSGPYRLCYAGSLVPQNASHPVELYSHASQPETFRCLVEQGLEVEVLCNPMAPIAEGDPNFASLFQLRDAGTGFRLRAGVPPDKLSEALADVDFGLILCLVDFDRLLVGRGTIEGGVGTKLFAYLEAGLPVIVNAEYEEMARMVTEHGIGLAVHSRDIPHLAERLKDFDYAEGVAAVRRFVEANGMPRQIARLVGLYERIGAGPIAG